MCKELVVVVFLRSTEPSTCEFQNCEVCRRTVNPAPIVRDHIQINHVTEDPHDYVCWGCRKTVNRVSNLTNHIKNVHLMESTHGFTSWRSNSLCGIVKRTMEEESWNSQDPRKREQLMLKSEICQYCSNIQDRVEKHELDEHIEKSHRNIRMIKRIFVMAISNDGTCVNIQDA